MLKLSSLIQINQRPSIEALQRALDETYRQLVETAKADWTRLFAGQDSSDSSTRVRISDAETAEELAAIPRAGVVPKRPRDKLAIPIARRRHR